MTLAFHIRLTLLLAPAVILIATFLGALLNVLAIGLQPVSEGSAIGSQYIRFLSDSFYLAHLWRSLRVALYTTMLCLIIGYPIAYSMSRGPRAVAVLITIVLAIQFFSIYVIKMYGWMLVLGNNGIVNRLLVSSGAIEQPLRLMYNELGVAIGLFSSALPLMVFPINAALQNVDPRLEEAAIGLGASRWSVLTSITLPLTGPGIIAGTILAFIFCFTAYLTPSLLGGGFFNLIGNFIYEQAIANFNYPLASAAAAVTLVISLTVITLLNLVNNRVFRVGR